MIVETLAADVQEFASMLMPGGFETIERHYGDGRCVTLASSTIDLEFRFETESGKLIEACIYGYHKGDHMGAMVLRHDGRGKITAMETQGAPMLRTKIGRAFVKMTKAVGERSDLAATK